MNSYLKIGAIGFCILVLGAFLRFSHLNSLPIFADESIYVRWSQVMQSVPSLRFLPLSDGKQPLYMWATIPMFKFLSDPLVAARSLSGLTGLGTMVGVGFVAYLLFKDWRHVLLAGLAYAIVPYTVFFDRMALADSMLAMFMIWGFGFIFLAVTKLRLDMAMLAGFCFGAAWLTKSPAIFGLALLPTLLLFLPKYNLKNLLVACLLMLVTCLLSLGIYNILRLGQEFHMIAIRNQDYVVPLGEVLKHPLDPLKPHLVDSLTFYTHYLTPIGILLIIIALIDKSHRRERLVLVAWILAPILAQSFVAKSYTARYILFTVPFALLLIAHGLYNIGQHSRRHFLTVIAVVPFAIGCLYFSWTLITNPDAAWLPRIERRGYLEEWTAGHGLREIGEYLVGLPADQSIVVGSEGFFGTPFDGLQLYTNGRSNIRIVGIGVFIDDVNPKLSQALVDNRVFLVVNASRLRVDPEPIGLKLISHYPKSTPPGGTADQLLFFEVTK